MLEVHDFGKQKSGEKTLSERILGLTPEQRSHLRFNAPYLCDKAGNIVRVSPVVVLHSGRPGVLEEAVEWSLPDHDKPRARKPVFPPSIPDGPPGFWEPRQRIFRSRYLSLFAFGNLVYPDKETVSRLDLRDALDVYHFLHTGKLFPFFNRIFLLSLPCINQPLRYRLEYNDVTYDLAVLYRGCPFPYEYPLRPSAFRRFNSPDSHYEEFKRYVSNLVKEYVWMIWRKWLNPAEVETIIQQFKILPWTYMVDVTYDLNIAMAFALMPDSNCPDHIPCLYQLLVMQPDTYEIGAHSVWRIPEIARFRQQCALSLVGFDKDMQDPAGFVISLSEHMLASKFTGHGWHELCGGNVVHTIKEVQEKLGSNRSWLFPSETKEVCVFVNSVVEGVRRQIDRFELDPDLCGAIDLRLKELEYEVLQSNGT